MIRQTHLDKLEQYTINSIVEDDVDLSDESNLSKHIVDLSLPVDTRIKALNLYYEKQGDNVIETVNKIIMMYQLSGTKVLRTFLYVICEKSLLPPLLQSFSAKALCTYDEKDELGYKAVILVYPKLGKDVGTPYKIDFIKLLMNDCVQDDYKEAANRFFCEIINDKSLNCDYRYKCILGLEEKFTYFLQSSLYVFFQNPNNKPEYRVLAGQYLLRKNPTTDPSVQQILLEFAENEAFEYNLRADATDVLLQLGSPDIKDKAQKIIMLLGGTKNNIKTLYDNAQNVHTREVEDSVKEALEFLQGFRTLENVDVNAEIMKLCDDRDPRLNLEKIHISLNRITMDRSLYSKYNCTLCNILLHVWTYIKGHKHEEQMKSRLLEELEEMSGTCSSGFAGRLVNTISGFGDFSMQISWRDQISGNLAGRINKRIQDMDNLTLQEHVMYEITLDTTMNEDRKHFLKFLRQEVFSLRDELYHEFKNYITDTDFDLYFRAAMSMYETGQFF
jgi:hypothetical protein